MSWFLLNRNLTLLEPYDWKLSCTVLRGERGSNAPDLPGNVEGNFRGGFCYSQTDELPDMTDGVVYSYDEFYNGNTFFTVYAIAQSLEAGTYYIRGFVTLAGETVYTPVQKIVLEQYN